MSILENTPGKKKLGRPSRSEKFGGHIAAAEQRIADNLPDLIDNLFELARGVTVREETQNGPKVYTRPPDRQSNEYLINRIMGKPTENAHFDISERRIIVERRDRPDDLAGEAPSGAEEGEG